jgi:hypothetical protein
MELALKNVQDVSEADVMQVLKAVVTHHRDSEADANAMQIDSVPTDIPPLPNFLLLCVSYKMSPRAMQLAMRQHLRDAADIVCVLEVLENWLSVWGTKDVPLLPDENNVKKLGGVYVLMPSEDKESDLPSLEKVSYNQTSRPLSHPLIYSDSVFFANCTRCVILDTLTTSAFASNTSKNACPL